MKRPAPLTLRKFIFSLLALLSSYALLAAASGKKPEAKKRNPYLPRSYKPIEQIEQDIFKLKLKYPNLLHVERIGRTTGMGQPIWAMKVSDNAPKREDEPRILFSGVHHAREPIGASICLELAKTLCEEYKTDPQIKKWVNSIEIWLVPVVNPDGYKYIFENDLRFPWWRKNLRDNDGDGVFNPLYDGVDLNRNYGYNWEEGGDGKPGSWFYRGETPFSENETRAIMNLVRRENFAIGISYHSYGESILFPWGNFKRPPDLELILEIAGAMAARIKRESGRGQYSILPLNGRVGQSSVWMYAEQHVIDYIIEVGTQYFPAEEDIPFIIKENLKGAFYLFDRVLETGIKGHVFDTYTKKPLLAEIMVKELSANYVKPRMTDKEFGGFYRLLTPGKFTLEIRSRGYLPKTIRNVRVKRGECTDFEIGLIPNRKLTNGH